MQSIPPISQYLEDILSHRLNPKNTGSRPSHERWTRATNYRVYGKRIHGREFGIAGRGSFCGRCRGGSYLRHTGRRGVFSIFYGDSDEDQGGETSGKNLVY